ncbi:MAG TPA: hypothetical protein VER11_02905 [Polyangiaceae bacterium]|nr:hypothetical protein [Polyangiaceae bacterium]
MCDCALGSIEPATASAPKARVVSSFWKFAALKQSMRAALRTLRVHRGSPRPTGARSGT